MGYFRDSIRDSGFEYSFNLIVTFDYGMIVVRRVVDDLVEFYKFFNFIFKDVEFEFLDYGLNGMLFFKEGVLEKVYEVLKDVYFRFYVYKKEFFFKFFRYVNNRRVIFLFMYSDFGYVIYGVSCL